MNIIKKNYLLLVFFTFYIFIMVMIVFRLDNYYIMTVGDITNLENGEISIDYDNDSSIEQNEGTIAKIFVYTYNKPTIYQYFISHFFEEIEIIENQSEYSYDENLEYGRVSKLNSLNNSIIAAFDLVQEGNVYIDYTITPTIYAKSMDSVNSELYLGKDGSEVLEVDGVVVDKYSDIRNELTSKVCETDVLLTLSVDGVIIEQNISSEIENGYCTYGLYFYDKTEIIDSFPKVNINYDFTSSGGSAGLMQSIYVYNQITSNDLTKGKVIAGSGTIDVFGNVGAIGGAFQKFYAAHYANADILFILNDIDKEIGNYNEVLRAKEKLNSNLEIHKVNTLKEAILILEGE